MATKKKPKKTAKRSAAPRKSITLVNERIILALESIAGSLEKLANPLFTVPAAATAAVVGAVTGDAAATPKSATAASELTDAELLS